MRKYILLLICLLANSQFSYADVWDAHVGDSVITLFLLLFLAGYSLIFIVIYLVLRISSDNYNRSIVYKIYNFFSLLIYILVALNTSYFFTHYYEGRFKGNSSDSHAEIWTILILLIVVGFVMNVVNLISIVRNQSSNEEG
jgi:hypothetical protein